MRADWRITGMALCTLALAACGDEGTHGTRDLVHFEDQAAGISLSYPRGWHQYPRSLTRVAEPTQKLVITSFAVRQGRPDEGCRPKTVIEHMPADGAFIYIFEYRQYAGRTRQLARFPRRPKHIQLRERTRVEYECFGLSYGVPFRDRGRAFQAHVYLGSQATATTRARVLRTLDSLRVEPANRVLPALISQPYMGVACPKPNSIACDRIGLELWLERPATRVEATIAGRRMRLRSPGTLNPRSGSRARWRGYLQPAGLKSVPLRVVFAPVRITARYRDGTSASRTLQIRLHPGWG